MPAAVEEIPQLSYTLLEFCGREFVALGQHCHKWAMASLQELHYRHIPWAGAMTGIGQHTYQAELWTMFEVLPDELCPLPALLLRNRSIAQSWEVYPHPAALHQVKVHRAGTSRGPAHAGKAVLSEQAIQQGGLSYVRPSDEGNLGV